MVGKSKGLLPDLQFGGDLPMMSAQTSMATPERKRETTEDHLGKIHI